MEGFDVLGAVEFEEYIVGAVIPDEKPVVRKLSKASQGANTAASKLARLKSPKAKRAAQKLRTLASAATTKGQKLSAAVARARTKVQSTLAKPFMVQAATRAAQYAEHAPAVVVVPTRVSRASTRPMMRTTASSPTRSMQTPRATASTPPARRGAYMVPSKGVSVLGAGFRLQAAANWVGPMLDVYAAFANATDDASVAAEVWAQTEPLTLQFEATNPSHPLLNDGYAIQDRANTVIESVEVPADPPAGDTEVGWWVGEVSSEAMSLQVDAIAWIKQARIALGQWGTPAAPGATTQPDVPPAPPVPPVPPVAPEMPPMNQSGGGSGGGGGGGSGGGEEEGAAPADESGMPPEGGEEGGYEEEGEEEYYATQGGGAGVQGVMDDYGGYEEDAEYAPDEGAYDEDEYASDESGEDGEETMDEDISALEALSLIGHGGGGHGGGGHGGHGHGGHGRGGRGMRGGWGGPWYGGPWYGDGYDVLLEDDEELADKIAKKVAQRQWASGRAHVGYVAPESHWYTVATPTFIKAEFDKVLREGETLDRDVASTKTSDASFPSFRSAWSTFWASYKKFYADTAPGLGWLSSWGSTADQVVGYGNQLNDWRKKLSQFPGARVTEPSVTAITRREDPTKFNYMPLVYGGIAVAALVGGGYALSHVSAIAGLFSRKKTA